MLGERLSGVRLPAQLKRNFVCWRNYPCSPSHGAGDTISRTKETGCRTLIWDMRSALLDRAAVPHRHQVQGAQRRTTPSVTEPALTGRETGRLYKRRQHVNQPPFEARLCGL